MWLFFLLNFNGRLFFYEDIWFSLLKLNLFIDVLGLLGFGVIFQWVLLVLWEMVFQLGILEFYFIVLSLYFWGGDMSNWCVSFVFY